MQDRLARLVKKALDAFARRTPTEMAHLTASRYQLAQPTITDYYSPMQAFDSRPPPLRIDEFGVIRLGTTRVSLESVVAAFDRGATAEEIVESFPVLDLATVYAVLAYVLTERVNVDEYLSQRQENVDKLRAEAEQRFPAQGMRARLLARREGTTH